MQSMQVVELTLNPLGRRILFRCEDMNYESYPVTSVISVSTTALGNVQDVEFNDDDIPHKVRVCIDSDGIGNLIEVFE